ncbi:TetR/AcrR family transcriptional regulator [Martelella alba]|uniref:TetR/AcrR family transcriptional regulator n=1 Tax=Martelella alba TaxID=2590451 RepID=A0A506TZ53_9HYPH|nr:TetR/AcrR family transcriptional regulator [Martelella alba]TPW26770.1 TetR/AcrR family transcriptional regulator [Martelella alba]
MPKGPNTRGPSREKRTRQGIIAAALSQFTQNGFAATTMEDISQECSGAKGTLYRYFARKEDLFLAIVTNVVSGILREARQIPQAEGETVKAYIKSTLLPVMYLTEASGRGDIARLVLTESRAFPDLAPPLSRISLSTIPRAFRGSFASGGRGKRNSGGRECERTLLSSHCALVARAGQQWHTGS